MIWRPSPYDGPEPSSDRCLRRRSCWWIRRSVTCMTKATTAAA